MKEDNITRLAVCPRCGKPYSGYPALSRRNNTTEICPDCGTREALEDMGIGEAEREQILGIIHSHNGCRNEH